MAGKKRRSSPGYKAQRLRYVTNHCKAKNKEVRTLRHELYMEITKNRIAEKTELFEKVCSKYSLDSKGKYALKRLIGTINISRLSAILDYSYRMENWFLERKLSDNALKLINNTKLRVLLD